MDIALTNLMRALGNSPRMIISNEWEVDNSAHRGVMEVVYRNPSGALIDLSADVRDSLLRANIQFTSGANNGVWRNVAAVGDSVVTAGTIEITLDANTPEDIEDGTTFVLMRPTSIEVGTDIEEVGGVAQTGADWTLLFQTLDIDQSALRDALTGVAPATVGDLGLILDQLDIEQSALRDALVGVAPATVGDLGLILDQLQTVFQPVDIYDDSTAAVLDVELDTGLYGGRMHVEVWVSSTAAATFTIYGSRDGANWREIDTIVLAAPGEAHEGYVNAYRYVRVATTEIADNEIEIVASR